MLTNYGKRQVEAELDVDDDLSPVVEDSLFLVSAFFDSLFDSDVEEDFEPPSLFDSDVEAGFELLSLFDSDEAGDFESLSLFDSPFVCPLRA